MLFLAGRGISSKLLEKQEKTLHSIAWVMSSGRSDLSMKAGAFLNAACRICNFPVGRLQFPRVDFIEKKARILS